MLYCLPKKGRLKIQILVFRRPFCRGCSSIQKQPYDKFVLREG
ncbi:hypothetical protein [Neisseria sicca]|nr:hypothetical protein [Neisseria sicca]